MGAPPQLLGGRRGMLRGYRRKWECAVAVREAGTGLGAGFFLPQRTPYPQAPILGDKSDSSFLIQDQRLVGFPSLRVYVPVGSHVDMVSIPAWLAGGELGQGEWMSPHPSPLPLFSALGPMASCTRSSGTNSCPSPCTRVSVLEALAQLRTCP